VRLEQPVLKPCVPLYHLQHEIRTVRNIPLKTFNRSDFDAGLPDLPRRPAFPALIRAIGGPTAPLVRAPAIC
jgi:hypothetical protein